MSRPSFEVGDREWPVQVSPTWLNTAIEAKTTLTTAFSRKPNTGRETCGDEIALKFLKNIIFNWAADPSIDFPLFLSLLYVSFSVELEIETNNRIYKLSFQLFMAFFFSLF